AKSKTSFAQGYRDGGAHVVSHLQRQCPADQLDPFAENLQVGRDGTVALADLSQQRLRVVLQQVQLTQQAKQGGAFVGGLRAGRPGGAVVQCQVILDLEITRM